MAEKTVSVDSSSKEPNNPLSKKLNKILETRLENDKEMLEALKSLSLFFTDNNLRSRRNLRGDIERRSLTINEQFVDNFKVVKEQLDSIYGDVVSMNDCCQDMTSRLKAAKAQTHDLINQTTKLQAESQKLAMRAKIADAFLAKFQLKPTEAAVLRGSRDGALHPDFFKALERVRQIHNDCKVLLRTNQQTAGLEIMESMALHQEAAYERLYRWAQNECRSLTSDHPDVSSRLCQAMVALQDRPVLFKFTLDEFGTARRTAIVRAFIDALTRGGPGGTPRPIELHSHDPLRYVGDMLGWLHQAAASEKEHVQTLLKQCTVTGIDEHVNDILSHITEGISRPLKVRVEQVLVSDPGALILYKIANLLKFYSNTIGQLVSLAAPLLSTLDEMHTLGLKMFFSSLAHNANKLLEKVELPPADLGPSGALNQSLQLLQDILSSHDSSVVPLNTRKQDFAQILSSVVDPLLQMCSMSASRLNTVDMATYMLNSVHLVQTTLSLYEFTDHRLEMLQAQIDAHIDTLVSEQASYTLGQAGVAALYATVQQHQPATQGPLSRVAAAPAVSHAMGEFDNFLSHPESSIMPQCSLLISGKLRETVKRRSLELICHAYRQMYAALTNPENQYDDPQSLVPRTPDQVNNLLNV